MGSLTTQDKKNKQKNKNCFDTCIGEALPLSHIITTAAHPTRDVLQTGGQELETNQVLSQC